MNRITPPVGTKGLFILREPFVPATATVYTVTSIRLFEDLIGRGIDPMKLVYEPVGLDESKYQMDQDAGAQIVTLRSPASVIYVPDTYIVSYPNMGVIPHSWIILSASLGILPDNYDLTRAMQAVQAALLADIGVAAEVQASIMPVTEAITQEQYVQNIEARRAAISNRTDDYTEKLRLQQQVDKLTTRNQELIEMVELLRQ